MSYNGSGTYVPPTGQPVATGTVIQSATFNTLVTDIGNTFNNVLPRDGQASMAGPLKITDGTSSVPGIAFNSEASTGIFRPVQGTLALVASGVENLRITNAGRVLVGTTTDDGINTLQVNGPTKVSGAFSAIGATSLSSLSTSGAATVGSTLAVTGVTSLSSLSTSGTATVGATLGIGTVAPGAKLDVESGNASLNTLFGSSATTVEVAFASSGNSATPRIGAQANDLYIKTNGNERLRIDTSGNVGMGTNAPAYQLEVVTTGLTGTTAGSNTALQIRSAAGGQDANIRFGDTVSASGRIGYLNGNMYVYTSGAERMRVDTSGNLLVGRTAAITPTSDVGTFERNQNGISRLVINNQNTGVAAQSMLGLEAYGAAWRLAVPSSTNNQNPLIVTTTGASTGEKMRLTYDGKVLIGMATDNGSGSLLQVNGQGSFIGNLSLTQASGTQATLILNSGVMQGQLYFRDSDKNMGLWITDGAGNSFTRMRFVGPTGNVNLLESGTGNVTIGTSSDAGTNAKLQISSTSNGISVDGGDNTTILQTRNTSASIAGQFSIAHNLGGVNITNARGAITLTANGGNSNVNVTGGLAVGANLTTGNLYASGATLLGGASGSYSSYASGLTLNYTGGGSAYGIALKPAASTSDTNALTFLTGGSTYASASGFAAIQHLAGDAAMNLSGPWRLNGNTLISSAQPTINKPTIKGYVEQVQTLASGAGGLTLNPDNGTLIYVDITANTTITLPAASPGLSYTLVVNYNGGNWSLMFAGGTAIRWAGGGVPGATSVSGKYDKYVFTCLSGVTLGQDGGRNF